MNTRYRYTLIDSKDLGHDTGDDVLPTLSEPDPKSRPTLATSSLCRGFIFGNSHVGIGKKKTERCMYNIRAYTLPPVVKKKNAAAAAADTNPYQVLTMDKKPYLRWTKRHT